MNTNNYTNCIKHHLLADDKLAAMRKIGQATTPCTREVSDWHLPDQLQNSDNQRRLIVQRLALCDRCPVLAECQAVIDDVPGQVTGGVWTRRQGQCHLDPTKSPGTYRMMCAEMGLAPDVAERILARHGVAAEEAAA